MNADAVITWQEIIFLAVFAVLVFGVPALVAWASYNPNMRLDLTSLWTHQNRIDKFAIILMCSWWLHSSSMVMWTLLRVVSTADWTTYQLWALPIMAKMFAPSGTPPETK